jgi:nucleoside 2-deoxyribosyltransferase
LYKTQIEQMNMCVYLFEQDQQPGQSVAEKVKMEIHNADILLVLLTRRSQFSPYVHQEIGYAEAAGKPIIPLVEPGTEHRILGMLEGREYISFDADDAYRALSGTQTYLHKHEMGKLERTVAARQEYPNVSDVVPLVVLAVVVLALVYMATKA